MMIQRQLGRGNGWHLRFTCLCAGLSACEGADPACTQGEAFPDMAVDSAPSNSGTLDVLFGEAGIVSVEPQSDDDILFPDHDAVAMSIQPDGKILLAGRSTYAGCGNSHGCEAPVFLARIHSDGSPDTSFGMDGFAYTASTFSWGSSGGIKNVIVQKGGRLWLSYYDLSIDDGGGYESAMVALFDTSGSLDASFGNGGYLAVPSGNEDSSGGMLSLRCDGTATLASGGALYRVMQEGTLDDSYGEGASVSLAESFATWTVHILEGLDQHTLIVGEPPTESMEIGIRIQQFNAQGDRDNGFGDSGTLFIPLDVDTVSINNIASNGRGYVLGASGWWGQNNERLVLIAVRLDPDGQPRQDFGVNGVVMLDVGQLSVANDWGAQAALQADGKVVIGSRRSGRAIVVRLTQDGQLDTTFGEQGIASCCEGYDLNVSAVRVHPDGAVVVMGEAYSTIEFDTGEQATVGNIKLFRFLP